MIYVHKHLTVAHPLCRKINYIIILWASITKKIILLRNVLESQLSKNSIAWKKDLMIYSERITENAHIRTLVLTQTLISRYRFR